MKTNPKLINIAEFEDEFVWSFGQEVFLDMLEHEGQEVEVICEATDGYYDIMLPNGLQIDAISDYHLK